MTAKSGARSGAPKPSRVFVLLAVVIAVLAALLQTGPAAAAGPQPKPTQQGKADPASPSVGKKGSAEHARPRGLELTRPAKSTAKTAAACSGTLGGGVIFSCDKIVDDTPHTYTLTTTKPHEIVLFRLAGSEGPNLDAFVSDGEGSCEVWRGPVRCDLAEVGTHTVTVSVTGGPAQYKLSAIDLFEAPCKALTGQDLAADSAGTAGVLVEGQFGDCFAFSGAAGDRLRFGVAASTAQVFDAEGSVVCAIEFTDMQSCELPGAGPYRAFVTQLSGVDTGYTFHLVKLNSPTGCLSLPLAQFGDPGTAVTAGQLALGRLTCRTVTTESGRHWIQEESAGILNQNVYDHDGQEACAEGSHSSTCTLPAGTFTILLENREAPAGTAFRMSIVPLAQTTGCAPMVGTRWDLPVLHKTATSPLDLDCQPIDAEAGERILARQVVNADGHFASIVDGAGADACDWETNYDGCLLKGTGPFRVLSGAVVGDLDYLLDIGRLSDPIGCTAAQLSPFNQAPPPAPAGSRCRTLTVDAPGNYIIDDGRASWESARGAYGPDGIARCDALPVCELAPGKYTIVATDTAPVSIFPLTSTTGCATQPADTFAARHGELTSLAQYDCLTLSSLTGAEVAPVEPAGQNKTEGQVVDADGTYVCSWRAWLDTTTVCKLSGRAPYRALLHRSDYLTGNDYSFAVPRVDEPAPCAALPQNDFSTTGGTAVTFGPAKFVTCMTVAANGHSATEAFQYARTGATGMIRMFLKGAEQGVCDAPLGDAEFTWCPMAAGKAYTAVVIGSDQTAAYKVARRDITSTAKGCSAITSSTIGATSGTGTIADGSALRCFKVPSAVADQYVVNTRGAASVGATVFRPSGESVCKTFGELRCQVKGSAGYQVIVWSDPNFGTPGAFKLETTRLSTAAGPAPECVKVPSAAYGFGPLTGEVSTSKTMNCVTFPLGRYDRVTGTAVSTVADVAPHVYARSVNGAENCMMSGVPGGVFDCWGDTQAGTAAEVMLFGLPEDQTTLKYTVSATCEHPLCGGAVFGVTSATPKTAVVGTTAKVTLKGTALHPSDVVRLTKVGKPDITGAVQSVSADRTTSVYSFKLAGVPIGARDLVVDSFAGSSVTLPDAFRVLGTAPTATKAPALSGTPQVNHTMTVSTGTWSPTCTAYTYQWYSGGIAVAGATKSSLALTSARANRSLYAAVTCVRTGYASGRAVSNSVTVRA